MGLDPTLITNALANFQPPADPLTAYAKIQALRNGVMQQQVQQQQLQSGALELQEKQKAMQDQQALSDAFKASYAPDPTTGKVTLDENALYRNMSAGGLGAKIPAVQKSIQDANESAVKFRQTQTAANEAAQDYLGQQLLYVKDAKYDPATFTATLGAAVSHGAIPAAEAAQLGQRLQQNPTPEGVQALVDPLINTSKTAQDILTKRATAIKDTAEGNKAAADEQRVKDQDFKNAYGNAGTPQAAAQIFAQAQSNGVSPGVMAGAPPPGAWTPAAGQAFAAQTLTEKDVAEIQQRKADAAALAANRTAEQQDRDANLAIARGRLGVEQARLKAETSVQGPFMGLPPQERAKAEAAYDKDTKDYTDKISAARGFQDMVTMAQAGNKAAPALVPIQELRGFLNRINSTELQAVGTNAGSVKDQVQGYIDGKMAGQPIPPALLNDMLTVSKAQEKAANRGYLGRLAANKAAFGASPPPIDIESVYAGGTAPPAAQPAAAPGSAQPAAAPAAVPGGALGQPVTRPATQPVTQPVTNAPPVSILKRGENTHFKNGQVWTIGPDGKPLQVK